MHYNFVVALLNDLFGIQSRGGCSCAGPYGHRLLGIDRETSARFENEIDEGCEVLKPGWVRVNFNYFLSESTFSYIVDAVAWIARHGWNFLPEYDFDVESGRWVHANFEPLEAGGLDHLNFDNGRLEYTSHRQIAPQSDLSDNFARADALVSERKEKLTSPARQLDDKQENLRWFALSSDTSAAPAIKLDF